MCNCASLEATYLKNLSQEFGSVSVLTEAPNLLSEKKANYIIATYHYLPLEAHPNHLSILISEMAPFSMGPAISSNPKDQGSWSSLKLKDKHSSLSQV